MTPTRARVLAGRWFILFAVVATIHIAIGVANRHVYAALDFPAGVAEAAALVFGCRHLGWSDGYRAATRVKPSPTDAHRGTSGETT